MVSVKAVPFNTPYSFTHASNAYQLEYAGLCLMYQAIHGEEDKKFMPNPADEEKFLEDFKDSFGG